MDNAILLMLVPRRLLRLPLLPNSWQRLGKAAAEFKQYMIDMLKEETSLLEQGDSGTGSLMTSFVRALNTHQKEEAATKNHVGQSPSRGLTVDEIFGNLFVINFAGHDTTANTLAFSMLLLAANPDVQDWVAEELREIIPNHEIEKWDYSVLYSDLKRCRAVLVCVTYRTHICQNSHCIARDPPYLPTNPGTSQMEQSAPTNTPYRRKDNCHSTPHKCVTKSTDSPNPSKVLVESSPLATLPVDLLISRSSTVWPQVQKQPSHPIASRSAHNAQAEHLLPLVRRAAELPRRKIRSGRIHRRAGLLATRSPGSDSP
jgi:Cytochrome P450